MKILYVDTTNAGHSSYYIESLLDNNNYNYVMLPIERYNSDKCFKFYPLKYKQKSFKYYYEMIRKVYNIVIKEKIDIVHFLYGDGLYRYFGFGLKRIKCRKVVTFHHIRRSKLKDVSINRIFKSIDIGVVHTKSLANMLRNDLFIKNVKHIEYPYFGLNLGNTKETSMEVMNICTNNKVLGSICGTRYDKGVDILLEALNLVKHEFHLLVAGTEEAFNKEYLEKHSIEYIDRTTFNMEYLTNEKLYHSINSVDFIVLPYRKMFDGASGPLTEGVALGKAIIGPNHGSLGQIIRDNHLGYTFEAENVKDLAIVIDKALSENFKYDDVANAYRESIKKENFQEKYKNLYEEII